MSEATIKFIDIPRDVLQYTLAPFLSSLVELNEALPLKMRIVRKFNKKWLADHHLNVTVEKLKSMLSRAELKTGNEKYFIFHKIVKELKKPITFQLYDYTAFKETIIEKLVEFNNHDLSTFVPVSIKWFYMFKRQCSKTLITVLNY